MVSSNIKNVNLNRTQQILKVLQKLFELPEQIITLDLSLSMHYEPVLTIEYFPKVKSDTENIPIIKKFGLSEIVENE